jgi:hypothetical protein
MMLHKLHIALAAITLALATMSVSAVDSASALGTHDFSFRTDLWP